MKKSKEEIGMELNRIIGIVCEGLGSQYGCFIQASVNVSIIDKDSHSASETFAFWIREEISKQQDLVNKLNTAYHSMKDKDTEYARDIFKMLDIREKILDLLRSNQ